MSHHNILVVASLIADPVRSTMLITLLDGRTYTASALAEAAGVTAQTASSHFSKLVAGGLLTVEKAGRHRRYQLAGPHVSEALERLASAGPVTPAWRNPPNRSTRDLRFARTCYDHLAGQLGVAVTQSLLERSYLVESGKRDYALTAEGRRRLSRIGVDLSDLPHDAPGYGRQCLDWTERQHHVAGALGARMMEAFGVQGWIRRVEATRTVVVTPVGWGAFRQHFGIESDFDGQQMNGLRLRAT